MQRCIAHKVYPVDQKGNRVTLLREIAKPASHSQHYRLLASAVAGRNVGVALSETGIAYTNGRVIYLAEGDDRQLLVGLIVQASLIPMGSLDPRIMARLIGRRQVALRYLTLEAVRALTSFGRWAPREAEKFVLTITQQPVSGSARESLKRAQTDGSIPLAPPQLGVLRPRKILSDDGMSGVLSALKPIDARTPEQTIDIPEAKDDDDLDESMILKLLSSPVAYDNFISRFLRNHILKVRRSPQTDAAGGGAEIPVGSMKAVNAVGKHAQPAVRPPELDAIEVFEQPCKATYPEWDWQRGAYRPAWCSVVELDPVVPPGTAGFPIAPDHVLKRNLARLGLTFETHKRRYDGESLDLLALINFAVGRAAGEAGDERIYESRLRTAHDLGVMVLLDASGSTAEHGEDRSSVWDKQRLLAANLISSLEAVGDRVAAFAFRSLGRNDIRFLRLKSFDERFGNLARARLNALEPSGFTRLGAALRHAAHIAMTAAGTSRVLLVLLSDGLPYEDGYEGRYAQEDTRCALGEAVERGVGCVSINVGAPADNAELEKVWGEVSYVRIPDPLALGPRVESLFRSALRAALDRSRGGASVRHRRCGTRAV